MPLDPSIPLQVKTLQLPDPLEGYTRAMTLQNLSLQNQQHQRQYDQDLAMEQAFRESGGNLEAALPKLMQVNPKAGLALQSQLAAQKKTALETQKLEGDIAGQQEGGAVRVALTALLNPDDATISQIIQQYKNVPGVAQVGQQILGLPVEKRPEVLQRLIMGMKGGREALQALQPKIEYKDTGGALQPVNLNSFAGPVGPAAGISPLPKSATPGEVMTDTRTRQEGALNRGVTIRGQNLTNERSRELNDIQRDQKDDQKLVKFRNDLNGEPEVKNYRAAVPVINSAIKAPDTMAGDIQFAYTIGKIFDPTSVVREGELKLVGEARTIFDRYMGEVRALVQGKGRLSPTTREELLQAAMSRVDALKTAHDQVVKTYTTAMESQGLGGRVNEVVAPVTHETRSTQPNPADLKQLPHAQMKQLVEASGQKYDPEKFIYRVDSNNRVWRETRK